MDRLDAEADVDSVPTHADLAGRPRSGRGDAGPIWPGGRGPAVAMLAGFATLAGVFPAATTEGQLVDGFDTRAGP